MNKIFWVITLLMVTSFANADTFTIGLAKETASAFEKELGFITQMYENLGHTVNIKSLPGARSLSNANSGDIDGDALRIATIAQQAPNLIPVKVALGTVKVTFFGKPDSTYKTAEDLNGLTLAAPQGIQLSKDIAAKHNMKLSEAPSLEAAAKMVGAGRADLFVFVEGQGLQAIGKAGLSDKVVVVGEPLALIPLFHFVHKKHAAIVPSLEEALSAITNQ